MKKNLKNHAAVGLCTLGLIGLNSCLKVDETYDLDKDFDMTITVGGDLTVPGSSTEQFLLGDLLDIEEDGVIRVGENGDYYLIQEGEQTHTRVEVPLVGVSMMSGFQGVDMSFDIPDINFGQLPEASIDIDENIVINVNEGGITSDLKAITNAVTSCDDTYLVFSNNSGVNAKLESGYSIVFPEYINVVSTDYNWTVMEGHIMVLTNPEGLQLGYMTRVGFNITGIDFDGNDAQYIYNEWQTDNNSIRLGGNVNMNGKILVSADSSLSGKKVSIFANVESRSMNLVSVTGVVAPNVDLTIDPIEIGELPDFLADNEVVLDLSDPRIYITLTNPSPVAVSLSAELFSSKEGKGEQTVVIPEFVIPANKPDGYTICINQIAGVTEQGVDQFVTIEKLSDVIKYIPERIEMRNIVAKVVEEEITVNMGDIYSITASYKVNTPLMFGQDTSITYTETMDGWDADLEDMEFERVEASMTVINAIPLGIKLTAEAIDKDGNKLEHVTVDMDVNIEPGSIDNPTKQNIMFALTTTNGSIKGLDGLNIKVVANSSKNKENESLNEGQYMKFEDIKLGLKGGITMDLN